MYERILLPLDGSEISESAIPHAETLALGCEAKKVTIVHVVEQERYEGMLAGGKLEPANRCKAAAGQHLQDQARRAIDDGAGAQLDGCGDGSEIALVGVAGIAKNVDACRNGEGIH